MISCTRDISLVKTFLSRWCLITYPFLVFVGHNFLQYLNLSGEIFLGDLFLSLFSLYFFFFFDFLCFLSFYSGILLNLIVPCWSEKSVSLYVLEDLDSSEKSDYSWSLLLLRPRFSFFFDFFVFRRPRLVS